MDSDDPVSAVRHRNTCGDRNGVPTAAFVVVRPCGGGSSVQIGRFAIVVRLPAEAVRDPYPLANKDETQRCYRHWKAIGPH